MCPLKTFKASAHARVARHFAGGAWTFGNTKKDGRVSKLGFGIVKVAHACINFFMDTGWLFFQGLPVYAQPPSFDDELIFYLAANECEGERKNWRYCKKTIQTSDDTIYVGNFLQGQPHGWGVTKNIETSLSPVATKKTLSIMQCLGNRHVLSLKVPDLLRITLAILPIVFARLWLVSLHGCGASSC